MAMVATNMSGHMQKQLTRSLERILEEAYLSGELKLSGRKLKDFPKVDKYSSSVKYNLQDTVLADLSKNRFTELPEEVTEFLFLEKLYLYHNTIRVIPETVAMLQSLNYLDLSRNQLTELPREICRLPLQTLLVAHNRLVLLPDELGRMSILSELDVGCNELTSLPSRIGDLPRIRSLDLRSNFLVQIPIELTYLKLIKLDISGNRISVLPNELRKMKTLVELKLLDNPLTSPPAALCVRGRIHIFKYLERQAAKHDRVRGSRPRRGPSEANGHVTLDVHSHQRHNVGGLPSTGEVLHKRWLQDFNNTADDNGDGNVLHQDSSPLSIHLPNEVGFHSSCSETSTPSTISPGDNTHFEKDLRKVKTYQEQLEIKKLDQGASENIEKTEKSFPTMYQTSLKPLNLLDGLTTEKSQESHTVPSVQPFQLIQTISSSSFNIKEGKKSLNHIQTYREYKEALKQQRISDGSSAYKSREQVVLPGNEFSDDGVNSHSTSILCSKQSFCEGTIYKRPVQKVTPSRINTNNSLFSNTSGNDSCFKNVDRSDQIYAKPNSPIKTTGDNSFGIANLQRSPKLAKTIMMHSEGDTNSSKASRPHSLQSNSWNSNLSENYSFTMRREYERAKEEADLVERLRHHIETRLKMTLPEELAPALADGVVLCHLANHVRPHSVASIHVPSPAVPKLTMARCRRNVDNFLEACRKIGVDEKLICCASDVLEGNRGIVRVAVTVTGLLGFYQSRSPLNTTTCSNNTDQVSISKDTI